VFELASRAWYEVSVSRDPRRIHCRIVSQKSVHGECHDEASEGTSSRKTQKDSTPQGRAEEKAHQAGCPGQPWRQNVLLLICEGRGRPVASAADRSKVPAW
jgi:hypothetical protein